MTPDREPSPRFRPEPCLAQGSLIPSPLGLFLFPKIPCCNPPRFPK